MTSRTLAALLAGATLTLTACQSAPAASRAAAEDASASAGAERDRGRQTSPQRIERTEDDGKPSKTHIRQSITGIGAWTVSTGMNIDGALGNELGRLSDAYLTDHFLRRDRWSGKWSIKEGEMDAYRAKVAKPLHATIETALASLEADLAQYGPDHDAWPRKVEKASAKRANTFGSMLLNNDSLPGGKGDLVYRATQRQIFRGTTELGWEGKQVGAPVTYVLFDVTRRNGTGKTVTVGVWQAWEKAKGTWRVFDAGWRVR